jgi:hypothetical protein
MKETCLPRILTDLFPAQNLWFLDRETYFRQSGHGDFR